jgi:hypothetical protein
VRRGESAFARVEPSGRAAEAIADNADFATRHCGFDRSGDVEQHCLPITFPRQGRGTRRDLGFIANVEAGFGAIAT